jgi:hypothetical protein
MNEPAATSGQGRGRRIARRARLLVLSLLISAASFALVALFESAISG